jgi:glutathione synthase/RimK-type ligase-like ATP-grasp enzyme
MTNFLLRRRKLGKTSTEAISMFSKEGIEVYRNDNPRIPDGNVVFRWGCTSNVEAKSIVNSAKAIHLVSDKLGFRKILQEHNLCPKTWFDVRSWDITYPCIVRPNVHHQGRHLWKCDNRQELEAAVARCQNGYYISEYIPKIAEYRVFVVSGRAVAVAKKTPADEKVVAWNVAQGGRFDNVRWDEWPLRAVRVAIEGFNLSGLDFGGVDIMEHPDGKTSTILEINSAPSLTSPYRQECMAKAFDYIVRNGKDKIPLVNERGGYLKFIHPAISENAKVI